MVTPCYYPAKGGTETVVRNLSIALNKDNVHTDVMTFNMNRKWNPKWQGKTEEIDGVTVFKIPGLNWLPIAHSYRNNFGLNLIPGKFTSIFKNYDIIHFHELDFSFPLFSCLTRKPKIIHLHGGIDFSHGVHLKEYGVITPILLKYLPDYYISLSRQLIRDLAFFNISKEKIAYLPNSVDTELFTPPRQKEDNLLLFVGRITFGKGIHVLLDALKYLKNPVRLVIIGPSHWDVDYYRYLERQIEKENRKGKHEIRYLGSMEQVDLVRWYQKASIFVLPSFSEAFGIVILEAFSCETPVVATSVGGIPEIVKNHQNGILVPPNKPLELAEAIQYLLDNRNVRTRMGKEGRKSIIREFSLKVIAERLQGIYKNVLNG
ncbi:MAG: glycosyltransferase family 4 protein [Candidatus Bathyarchaeota archaeon]|nr:glycosyltransferase family 4 protein [Candidatus Bathyarchaeota archaeon]